MEKEKKSLKNKQLFSGKWTRFIVGVLGLCILGSTVGSIAYSCNGSYTYVYTFDKTTNNKKELHEPAKIVNEFVNKLDLNAN